MNVEAAYDNWAILYDTNENKTRDLEGVALRKMLATIDFVNCLEIGCGTGKNTEWLISKAATMVAVDLSGEMLAKAKAKISSDAVAFIQADIHEAWHFAANQQFDLAVFSLVLEHIQNLDEIFEKLSGVVRTDGYVYIGELHPFKQYMGSKARFETENGLQIVTCFNHNVSDFTNSAKKHGFEIVELEEFFDEHDRNSLPRILTLLLKRKAK